MTRRNVERIVVVGASAGGVEALADFVNQIDFSAPIAVFVVLHVSPTGVSVLPKILARAAEVDAAHAVNGESVVAGRIYVAPPDHHMVVEGNTVRLNREAKENAFRPAIDRLFRSAAQSWGSRTIGVVLTGALDDGSVGMLAIKGAGGKTFIQDPNTALYPSMPRAVAEVIEPDAIGTPKELGRLIAPTVVDSVVALDLVADVAELAPDPSPAAVHPKDVVAPYACPNCNGSLFEMRNDNGGLYFRCRVGHGYSAESLIEKQAEFLDDALWTALRALEERRELSERLAARMTEQGHHLSANKYLIRARDAEEQSMIVRQVLVAPVPGDIRDVEEASPAVES